jgi:hypothetical protein
LGGFAIGAQMRLQRLERPDGPEAHPQEYALTKVDERFQLLVFWY